MNGVPMVRLVVNGVPGAYPCGVTLAALVAGAVPVGRTGGGAGIAAAVGDTVVPRGAWAATVLADGDRVEVLTAVQGG